uniref:Uncharacterized protein MANES_06G138200 n=1 Tax=Rhizophora mucronata TaxID=61149 RepID=A0A2P2K409_RHIMU
MEKHLYATTMLPLIQSNVFGVVRLLVITRGHIKQDPSNILDSNPSKTEVTFRCSSHGARATLWYAGITLEEVEPRQ